MRLLDFLPSDANGIFGLPIVATEITAGEAVQAGDLIVQTADGQGYWAADPALPGAKARPLLQTADVFNGYLVDTLGVGTANGSGGNSSGATTTRIAALTSGDVALAWIADDGVNIATYSSVGERKSGPTLALAGVNTGIPARLSITTGAGGGFSVAYGSATSGGTLRPRVAFFNAAGASVAAPVNLETSGGAYDIVALGLANGNTHVAWVSGAQALKVATFNANTGQQVGTTQTLATGLTVSVSGNSDPTLVTVKSVRLTGNNYTLVWLASSGASQNALYAAVFDGDGGQVLAPGQLANIGVASATAVRSWFDLTATLDGGFGVAASAASDGGSTTTDRLQAAKYNAAGALQGSVQLLKNYSGDSGAGSATATTGIAGQAAVALASGAFLVLNVQGTVLQAAAIGSDGTVTKALAATNVTGLFSGRAITLQDGSVAYIGQTSTGFSATRIALKDGLWTGSDPFPLLSLYTGGGTMARASHALVPLPDVGSNAGLTYAVATFAASSNTGNAAKEALHYLNGYVQARWVAGVAQKDTGKGGAIPTQILGPRKTRLTFRKPFSLDQTAAPAPSPSFGGQKMSVVGNMAVLKGPQV